MREILFRGKRADNGEWIYGVPCYFDDSRCHIVKSLYYAEGGVVGAESEEVISETVGQLVFGICDKNGKKIFEGDILEHRWNFYDHEYISRGIVVNKEWDCGCCYSVFGFTADIVDNYRTLDLCDHDKSVVIGNIHDNPELLKESEK